MREVTLEDGRVVKVRSIRWKALRQMEAEGLTPNGVAQNPEKADEALLRQMEEAGIDERTRTDLFENGLFSDCVKISRAIWAETYGHEGEEKLIEAWAWASDPKRRAYCAACREEGWADSCEGCENAEGPRLLPANREAWQLWEAVDTQWRGAGLGLVGLDYAEVRWWARHLAIDLSHGLWGKIRALERFELERMARSVLTLNPSIKGIRQLQKALGAESAAQKRALNAAIRVEGFTRLRELRDQIAKGSPGGHPYGAQLSEIARRTKRGKLRKRQIPLYRLARILRYQVEMKGGDLQLSFGFVSQGPRKISGSWKQLLLKHHEGVSVLYGKSRTRLGIELANIGGRLKKQGDPDARFFFLRRTTGRNIRLPRRPTVDPFYQANRQPMLESIRRNYRRKLAGERI